MENRGKGIPRIVHFILVLVGTIIFLMKVRSVPVPHSFMNGNPSHPEIWYPEIAGLLKSMGYYLGYVLVVMAHGLLLGRKTETLPEILTDE